MAWASGSGVCAAASGASSSSGMASRRRDMNGLGERKGRQPSKRAPFPVKDLRRQSRKSRVGAPCKHSCTAPGASRTPTCTCARRMPSRWFPTRCACRSARSNSCSTSRWCPAASWPAPTPPWCARTWSASASTCSSRRACSIRSWPEASVMAELPRALRPLGWGAAALVLSLLPLAWTAEPAWFGPLLAQPLWQEAIRRARARPVPASIAARIGSLAGPLALWALGAGLLALAVAWPLSALRASGALAPAIGLSLSLGCVWLGLWRLAPAFARAAYDGGPLRTLLGSVPGTVANARGLALAATVLAVLALGLALAWPGMLPAGWRTPAILALPVLALACHAFAFHLGRLPQRTAAARVPVVAMAGGATTVPAEAIDGNPDARLYEALREGRIEAALAALDAGANPLALPAADERDQRTLAMLATVLGDMRPLRRLIAAGAELNRNHHGLTPLLAATRDSWHGRPEA